MSVEVGTSRRDRHPLNTAGRKRFPKFGAKLLIAIVQQVTTTVQIAGTLHRCITSHLLHPARVRMARDAAQPYAAAAYFDEEQNVVRHQSSPGQQLHGEEVGASQHVQVQPDELLPRRRATSLGRWSEVVPAQDVADRSIRDSMAQIGERAHNPVVSPAAVLARETDHERLYFR